jgi:hypothetical protein
MHPLAPAQVQHMYDVMFPENEIELTGRPARAPGGAVDCQKQEVQSTNTLMDRLDDGDDASAYKPRADAQNGGGSVAQVTDAAEAQPSDSALAGVQGEAGIAYDLVHFLCDLDGAGAAGLAGRAQCSSAGTCSVQSDGAGGHVPVKGGGVDGDVEGGLRRSD